MSLLMHPRLEPARRAVGAHSPGRIALKRFADRAFDRAAAVAGRTRSLDALADAQPPLDVLLVAVYVSDPGLLPTAVAAARASKHNIVPALGTMAGAAAPAVSDVTVATGLRGGKFPNVNAIISAAQTPPSRWTILLDSDVTLPPRFFDRFIALAERFDLALAQPALTLGSYHSHAITRRRPWSLVRETRFVEIGPLTAFREEATTLLLPFAADSGMGWGLDLHWPAVAGERGLRMGIVDATPVGHEQEPFGTNYSAADAERMGAAWLADRPSLPRSEAQRVLATHVKASW